VTSEFGFDHAKAAAEQWFKNRDLGVSDQPTTVAVACREYVADLKAEGRESAAHDADMRFRRIVYDHEIGATRLDKLRTTTLKTWRNELGGSKSSQNRNLAALKAALNLAVLHRRVSSNAAQEWREVKSHRNADNRREIFLDLKQRRALLKDCDGPIRDLVEAAMLTGARAGELVTASRSQFDGRTGMMKYVGKTGTRTVPLSPAALELFKRLAKGKLPTAYLLTRDDGLPWKHRKWAGAVREAARRAKLPAGVCLYVLRHSWITEAILAGMSTLEVSKLTGTSLPMIEKHYGHLAVEAARERLAQITLL
jgi:integrase